MKTVGISSSSASEAFSSNGLPIAANGSSILSGTQRSTVAVSDWLALGVTTKCI
jgi:uncharacterized Zn-binding protein involved in type VI secretion